MLIIENVNRSFRWEYNYYFDLCQEILQKKFWTRSSPLMIKLPVRAFPHKFSNRLPLKMFSRKISSTDRSNNSDTNHNMETHRTFWVPYLLGRFSFLVFHVFLSYTDSFGSKIFKFLMRRQPETFLDQISNLTFLDQISTRIKSSKTNNKSSI